MAKRVHHPPGGTARLRRASKKLRSLVVGRGSSGDLCGVLQDRNVRLGLMLLDLSRIRLLATCAVVVVATASCGGDSGPTAPSPQSQIPNVAGTYRGPLTITGSDAGGVLMVSLNGTMQITVVQAGAQLTITGSTSIFEETSALEPVTGTVNETGLVTFPPDSPINTVPIDDTCGTITPAPTMLTFSGNTARFLQTASSDGCGNFEVLGTLTRQ